MSVDLAWLLLQRELELRLVNAVDEVRPLTWAHAIDAIDPTDWLTGGELVLTTGLRLPRAVRDQRAYVERLAGAGVAALGFGVGVRFDEIPPAVAESCSEWGLPLLEVPIATPFIAVTQAVSRRLTEQQVETLQKALTDQRRITRSAVRGGLAAVVSMLSRELQCDVVVLDEYGVVMASSTRRRALLERIHAEWRRLAPEPRRGSMGVATDDGTLELQTLPGRSAVVGWLAVQRRSPASPTDRLLLNQAAGLMTLQLDWPAELIDAYHSLGGALLDLMLDPAAPRLELAPHLRHFGFEPHEQVVLAVVSGHRSHARILEVVSLHLEAAKRSHVVTAVDHGAAALLLERDAAELVGQLEQAVTVTGLGGAVIGVSGSLAQTEVVRGREQADLAAAAARTERRKVGWFGELTLGAVVGDEAIRSRVWSLGQPALEALTRDASPRESSLVASLEAFLKHNGSWEAAAHALGVHRHTLRNRMARVEDLTGLSLDSAENRVLLLLALMTRPQAQRQGVHAR